MKIGQEVIFKNDFKIETLITGTKLQVKEGDKGLIIRNGIKILNGEAKGKIIGHQDYKITKGYDHENIARMIYKILNNNFDLGLFLEDEEIDTKEVIEEIEGVLMEIL